jgi:hypothetical protein
MGASPPAIPGRQAWRGRAGHCREASLRQALVGNARWAAVPCRVATASPALALGPTEAAWLLLDQARPGRVAVWSG